MRIIANQIVNIMMRKSLFIFFLTASLSASQLMAQELPFSDISKTEIDFSTGNVVARMVEGLGFRYYWATEGLNKNDLAYKASETGRSSMQTVDHIYGLSTFFLNFIQVEPIEVNDKSDFNELRKSTLLNLEKAVTKLKSMEEDDFKDYTQGQLTFWQMINGPVADALWHTGQVVMMRRASGNPLPKGVNVLMGVKN